MKLLEQIVNQRINRVTRSELLKYANQYGISLTSKQADQIVVLLHGKNVNIFDPTQRAKVVKEVARITNPKLAKELNRLFLEFIGSN